MSIVVQINGSDHPWSEEAKPDASKRVYGCGYCEDQGHRLFPDNTIECGQSLCGAVSAFLWYVPSPAPIDVKRIPRTKESHVDKRDNLICPRCSHNRFHLHPSGTVTCYRCRHSVSHKWWLPTEEGVTA